MSDFLSILVLLPEDFALRHRPRGLRWAWSVEQDGDYSFDPDYAVTGFYEDPRDAVEEAVAYRAALVAWSGSPWQTRPKWEPPAFTPRFGGRVE